MSFILVAGLAASLIANMILGYMYFSDAEDEQKVQIPERKKLFTEDVVDLLELVREKAVALRTGYAKKETAEQALDMDILEYKLMYLHASLVEQAGGKTDNWSLDRLSKLPGYSEEELDDLYSRSGRS